MSSTILPVNLRRYRSPKSVIGRFTIKRTIKSATFLALVFGLIVGSKAAGFVAAFPDAQARHAALSALGNSTGIVALVGRPVDTSSVGSYAAWNTLISMVMIGGIWALLTATRLLRGEEEMGRWELLLTGQTTAKRALSNVVWGLGITLAALFALTGAIFAAVGQAHKIDYPAKDGLIFAGTVTLGVAMFMALGVLTSQLMPTRTRASALAAGIFGASFVIRALADVANVHWLLALSPLGWIEQVHPLADNHVIWLLPAVAWIVVVVSASFWLASKRDLGASTFPDQDSAKPHYALLNRPITAAFRLTRASTLGWLVGTLFGAFFFGALTKTAANAFNQVGKAQHFIGSIIHASQTASAKEFLGVAFFMLMILLMCFAASAVHAIRQDESRGYLDNMLVRPVSRLGWLTSRTILVVCTTMGTAFLAGAAVWVCVSRQGLGLVWHDLLLASINMFAPIAFVVGLGVCMFGILPRLASLVMYSLIAWSFLIQIISSGVKLSHWALDTSIFQHVALAPATDIKWSSWWTLIGLSAGLCVIGIASFVKRDIVTE